MPTIITLHAPSTEKLLISVFPNTGRDPDFATASRVRSMAEQDGLELLPTAVEQELVLAGTQGQLPHGVLLFVYRQVSGRKDPAAR